MPSAERKTKKNMIFFSSSLLHSGENTVKNRWHEKHAKLIFRDVFGRCQSRYQRTAERKRERESGSGKWDAEQKEMRPETTGLIRAAAANDRKVVDFRWWAASAIEAGVSISWNGTHRARIRMEVICWRVIACEKQFPSLANARQPSEWFVGAWQRWLATKTVCEGKCGGCKGKKGRKLEFALNVWIV